MNELLKPIADNPMLLKALREHFGKFFSLDDIKTAMDNETLGQFTRARVDGLMRLDQAFKEIEACATIEPRPPVGNPGR